MGELVFLVVALGEGDEDAAVVDARGHPHGGAGELGGDLVVAPCVDAPLRTVVPVRRDRRVVRGLFGEEGYSDGFLGLGRFIAAGLEGVDCRLRRGFGRVDYGRGGGFDLPGALDVSSCSVNCRSQGCRVTQECAGMSTNPEKLPQR